MPANRNVKRGQMLEAKIEARGQHLEVESEAKIKEAKQFSQIVQLCQ